MNYIKDINLIEDGFYNIIIEIPKGTNSKYELVEPKNDHVEEVRKVICKYPFYYGCFPQTLAGDKDPLDIILFTDRKYNSLDIVKTQIIGVIKTIDNGEVDDKILVIPYDEVIEHLDKLEKKALKFLSKYKGKNSNTQIDYTIYDCGEAIDLIEETNKNYINRLNSKSTKSIIVDF